jgi:hypothetical protein
VSRSPRSSCRSSALDCRLFFPDITFESNGTNTGTFGGLPTEDYVVLLAGRVQLPGSVNRQSERTTATDDVSLFGTSVLKGRSRLKAQFSHNVPELFHADYDVNAPCGIAVDAIGEPCFAISHSQ